MFLHESWRVTHKILASTILSDNALTVRNVRDFRYLKGIEDAPEQRFQDMTFSPNDIIDAWIAIIPFRPHFAHLITSFGLRDGTYIAISIEIRYRAGEYVDDIFRCWNNPHYF